MKVYLSCLNVGKTFFTRFDETMKLLMTSDVSLGKT